MIHGSYVGSRLEILAAWGFQKNLKIFAQHLSTSTSQFGLPFSVVLTGLLDLCPHPDNKLSGYFRMSLTGQNDASLKLIDNAPIMFQSRINPVFNSHDSLSSRREHSHFLTTS